MRNQYCTLCGQQFYYCSECSDEIHNCPKNSLKSIHTCNKVIITRDEFCSRCGRLLPKTRYCTRCGHPISTTHSCTPPDRVELHICI